MIEIKKTKHENATESLFVALLGAVGFSGEQCDELRRSVPGQRIIASLAKALKDLPAKQVDYTEFLVTSLRCAAQMEDGWTCKVLNGTWEDLDPAGVAVFGIDELAEGEVFELESMQQ
jgi:hypothetical protein